MLHLVPFASVQNVSGRAFHTRGVFASDCIAHQRVRSSERHRKFPPQCCRSSWGFKKKMQQRDGRHTAEPTKKALQWEWSTFRLAINPIERKKRI